MVDVGPVQLSHTAGLIDGGASVQGATVVEERDRQAEPRSASGTRRSRRAAESAQGRIRTGLVCDRHVEETAARDEGANGERHAGGAVIDQRARPAMVMVRRSVEEDPVEGAERLIVVGVLGFERRTTACPSAMVLSPPVVVLTRQCAAFGSRAVSRASGDRCGVGAAAAYWRWRWA